MTGRRFLSAVDACRRRRPAVSLGVLAVILVTQIARGQESVRRRTPGGGIMGTVTDSELRPIGNAEAAIALSRVRVTTDETGKFRIVDVPIGNYLLTVRRLGFRSVTAGIAIHAEDTLRLAFLLEAAAAELPVVNVTGTSLSERLRGFEARRRGGLGEFLDDKDISARNPVSTVDVLRSIRSLRVTPAGAALVALSARQATRCPMQVYIDGVLTAGAGPGSDLPLDLNQLPPPQDIAAIEVYAGSASVPVWLPVGPQSGRVGCGAILVWTRDGSGE